MKSTDELIALVKKMKAGDEVQLNYYRDGNPWSVKVKLTTYKELSGERKAPLKKKEEKKKQEPTEEPAPKQEEPEKEKTNDQKESGDVIDELMKKAAKNGGRLEVTPELVEKMGGMEKLMKELEKRGGMTRLPNPGPDKFFESSMNALAPVSKKNEGSTALVLIDDKLAALGTVISTNGRILTKNTETQKGKLSIRLGDKKYDAMVLKRFPERDLALLKIDAEELHPVRFQAVEPPLGSILTATGAKDEPLGIGLLSVPGRAMAKVGFIGIQGRRVRQGGSSFKERFPRAPLLKLASRTMM